MSIFSNKPCLPVIFFDIIRPSSKAQHFYCLQHNTRVKLIFNYDLVIFMRALNSLQEWFKLMVHNLRRIKKTLLQNALWATCSPGVLVLTCFNSERDTWKHLLFPIHWFIFSTEIVTYLEIRERKIVYFSNKQVWQILNVSLMNISLYEISGSFSRNNGNCRILGCDAMQSDIHLQTFGARTSPSFIP